jgi:GTP-binding protein HflX
LVGYTNAGKSTMLNELTDADVPAADRLFETLDPRTRQLALPGGEVVLVTDTVGFVAKLPHELVEAFRSTLDSVRLADLLLHIVDASAADPQAQIDAVHTVLEEIGASAIPELIVINKADRAPRQAQELAANFPGSVVVSAAAGTGIERLLSTIGDRLRTQDRMVQLRIPHERGDVVAAAHREGEVVDARHDDEATVLHVVLDDAGRAKFEEFEIAR